MHSEEVNLSDTHTSLSLSFSSTLSCPTLVEDRENQCVGEGERETEKLVCVERDQHPSNASGICSAKIIYVIRST